MDQTHPHPQDAYLLAIIEARRAAESAICLAMVTSYLPRAAAQDGTEPKG